MAGGTDLLGVLKGELLPEYPETIVALRDIPDTDYIKREDNLVKIGSMTRLAAIETVSYTHLAVYKRQV